MRYRTSRSRYCLFPSRRASKAPLKPSNSPSPALGLLLDHDVGGHLHSPWHSLRELYSSVTILTGLPAAAFGGLPTLSLFHAQLDIYGFVGLIMLIGIVKKNAIMMVDFALELERKGITRPGESAYQGCVTRFRPIMMTSACTVIGTLPVAIGIGANASARRSLGLCVVGGLIFAQCVTLYITPVFYTYMDAFMKWRANERPTTLRPAEPADALLAYDAKHIAHD